MLKKFLILALLFSYLLCTLAAKEIKAPSSYKNADIGVKIDFPESWSIYTSRKNASKDFVQFFPKRKKRNESPLFYGVHSNNQLGTRLMFEKYNTNVIEYFDLIYGISSQVQTISAKYSLEKNTVEWVYNAKKGALSYIYKEIFTPFKGNMIRLTFWTVEPIYPKYEKNFNNIIESTFFLEAENKWTPQWENIQSTLSSDSLSYVKTISVDKEDAATDCGDNQKDVFWSVKGEKNTVYLFGSIHLGKPDFYPFNEKIESAFKRSQCIGVEINPNDENTTIKLQKEMAKSMYTGKKTIKDHISAPIYKKLEECFTTIGLPIDNFLKFPPWVLSVTLITLKMQSMGYHPDYGVEKYFLDAAKDSNKTIVELETVEEQLSLFNTINNENFLAYNLFSLKTMGHEAKKLIHAWQCGKLDVLKDLLFDDFGSLLTGMDDIYETLFFKRNIKMAEKIKKFLKGDKDYFVILGAGHFIGEKGIVSLLTKDGYKVIR